MIAYIEGRVAQLMENACVVITASGVGYEVSLTSGGMALLPSPGESVCFHIATVVREDAIDLYGFESWDERQTFLVLLSISRVGARTAMSILSVFKPDDLRRMVAEDDVVSLTRVSGIGKKTGQQIFLELKYKLKGDAPMLPSKEAGRPGSVMADAVAGLSNLGYDEEEALQTVKEVLAQEPDLDVSGALRASLKLLARSRA